MSIRRILAMLQYGKQIGKQAVSGARCFASTKKGVTTYTTLDKDFKLLRTKTTKTTNLITRESVVRDAKGQITDVFEKKDNLYINPYIDGYSIVHTSYDNNVVGKFVRPKESFITSDVCWDTRNGEGFIRTTTNKGIVKTTNIAEDGTKTKKQFSLVEYLKTLGDDMHFNWRNSKLYTRELFNREG